MSHPYAEVLVEFFTKEAGGRKKPPLLDDKGYCPHFRVIGDTEYLGVEFVDGPDEVRFNVQTYATVRFLYEPDVSYELLTVGTSFEILEGPFVVGRGKITRR